MDDAFLDHYLRDSCSLGDVEGVASALRAGANPNRQRDEFMTPLTRAVTCGKSALPIVKRLLASGAELHGSPMPLCFSITDPDLWAWLKVRNDFCTRWHFFSEVSEASLARALARGQVGLHRRQNARGRSVLEVAARAPDAPNAHLVLQAAAPWSPATHRLWPPGARRRALHLLRAGYALAATHGRGVLDVWLAVVLPYALGRRSAQDQLFDATAPVLFVAKLRARVAASQRQRASSA